LSPLLFKVRRHCPTLQYCAELCVDHQTVTEWSQFCCSAKSNIILSCSLQLFNGGYPRECRVHGRVLEIGGSCFVRQKCNCSRLRETAWEFVDVNEKLETLVLNLLLIATPRHYSPSLRRVSYPAPQSSVSAVGTFVSSMKGSHTTVDCSIILWRTDAQKYDQGYIKARQISVFQNAM
jgi:hypothetical protein